MTVANSAALRRWFLGLACVCLTATLGSRPREATLASDPKVHAFVSSLVTWDDHALLAWYGGATQEKNIRIQRLDSTLAVFDHPVVLTDLTRDAFEPRLARSGNDVLIAWYEKNPDTAEFTAQLVRLGWDGKVRWHHLLAPPGHSSRNPVVCATAQGAWVAWLEAEQGESAGVWAEQLSADGLPTAPAQRVGSADRGTTNLNAAVDATGQWQVVFDAKRGGGSRELQLVTVGPHGAQQRALTRDDGADSVYPDIAIDGDHVAVVWVDARAGQPAVLLAVSAMAELDTPLDTHASVLTHGAAQVGGSYLAWNRGRLGVAWNASGREGGLYLQRFDDRGRARGDATRIAEPAAGSARAAVPSLAPWKKGFGLAWNEYTTDEVQHAVLTSTAQTAVVD